MKKVALSAILLLTALLNANANGALQISKVEIYSNSATIETQPYDKELLTAISDTMFQQGNPNYMWVDLLRDGYISGGKMVYDIFLYTNKVADDETISKEMQQLYVAKWDAFVRSINQPHTSLDFYHFNNIHGTRYADVINPASKFRQYSKVDLHSLDLTSTGRLRLLNEVLKDGYSTKFQVMNYDFSQNGFYINGKLLPDDLRDKYSKLCAEEFGYSCMDGSAMKHGPLPDNTLRREIETLTERINAAQKRK